MKNFFEILKNCALFEDISGNDLSTLLDCFGAKISNFKKNGTVFSEYDSAEYIGIILSGTVRLEITDYFGNRSILTTIEQGEMFGESFACADIGHYPINIIASKDSEIMLINSKKILNRCSNSCSFHNQIVFNLLKIVSRKNLILNQKLEIISKRTTREKLLAYLYSRAKECKNKSFSIPFDRQALADYLGVDRSGLSAVIGTLCKEKVIECKQSRFTLL